MLDKPNMENVFFSLVIVNANFPKKIKLKKGNGGWGDLRDHQLCLNISDQKNLGRVAL